MDAPAAPQFTIATPSFRSSEWLKLCIASVADQDGVSLEHIVQDAGSDDGTLDWLPQDPRVKTFVEKDSGMYDAVNRGWRRARGEILAYLNCDEQYLPGTLKQVASYFAKHPDVDILCGDVVVVGPNGDYKFHRKILPPTLYHTWVCHLASLTCSMFVRRSFVERHDLYFDPKFRVAGDGEWMVRALRHGARIGSAAQFFSTFGDTGVNLSTNPSAVREQRELAESAPAWARALRPLWIALHRLRRAFAGIYQQQPFSYSVYTPRNATERTVFRVERPTFRWRLGDTESKA